MAVVLAALAALALVAVGCGGGDDESLTKTEFLKKGNAICTEGNKEIEKDFESFVNENNIKQNQQPTKAQLTELAEESIIPSVQKQVSGIEDLSPPEGEEAQVEAILAAANEGIEKTEEDPSSIAVEHGGPFDKANKLAREYGLVACGEE